MAKKSNINLNKPGGKRGRPKGVPNKATREIKEAARALLERPAYLVSLRRRVDAGEAPHMETLLHHYAYGKPKDEAPPPQWLIDPATLAAMSTADLEKALVHAEIVQNFLSGKMAPQTP